MKLIERDKGSAMEGFNDANVDEILQKINSDLKKLETGRPYTIQMIKEIILKALNIEASLPYRPTDSADSIHLRHINDSFERVNVEMGGKYDWKDFKRYILKQK